MTSVALSHPASDEFKRDAVDPVVTTDRQIAEVATDLGVHDSTVGNWVRRHQEEQPAGNGMNADERACLKELEAENAKLRVERDLIHPGFGEAGSAPG